MSHGRSTLQCILSGEGVGRDAIEADRAIDGQISVDQVRIALGMIKGSDKHLALMKQVQARTIAGGDAEAITRAAKMILAMEPSDEPRGVNSLKPGTFDIEAVSAVMIMKAHETLVATGSGYPRNIGEAADAPHFEGR